MNGDFFNATLGVIDQFKELRAVLHGVTSLAHICVGSSVHVSALESNTCKNNWILLPQSINKGKLLPNIYIAQHLI
jgi:hypothetical protein